MQSISSLGKVSRCRAPAATGKVAKAKSVKSLVLQRRSMRSDDLKLLARAKCFREASSSVKSRQGLHAVSPSWNSPVIIAGRTALKLAWPYQIHGGTAAKG